MMDENKHPATLQGSSLQVEDLQARYRQLSKSCKDSTAKKIYSIHTSDTRQPERPLRPTSRENISPTSLAAHKKQTQEEQSKNKTIAVPSSSESTESLKLSEKLNALAVNNQDKKEIGNPTLGDLKSSASQKLSSSTVSGETQRPSSAGSAEGSEKRDGMNNSNQRFKLDDFLIGRPLGRGRFGSVYLAQTKVGKHIVALKILYKEHLKKEKVTQQLKREIEIHSRLKHENVIRLHSYFHDEKRVFLVLEYAPGGELFTAMRNAPDGRFDERRAATVMKQLFRALRKCQKYQVVHRDIKPENILIGRNNRIKLADFGWSVNNTDSESMKRRTMCGTVEYIPPEMVHEQAYDERVDIWGAGVLMYEMLVGRSPFTAPGSAPFIAPDEGDTMWRVVNCEVQMPSFLSPEAKDLISKLVVKEPEKRLPIKFALQHPWIQKFADPDETM